MTSLQWTNAVALAIAVTMAMMMAVVSLLFWVNLDEAPRLREQLPLLLGSTIHFTVLAIAAGLAFIGHRRRATWRWPAQGLLVIIFVLLVWRLWDSLSA